MAKDWRVANPDLIPKNLNICDTVRINELTVLSKIESMNSVLIHQGIEKAKRFNQLQLIAEYQLKILNTKDETQMLQKNLLQK